MKSRLFSVLAIVSLLCSVVVVLPASAGTPVDVELPASQPAAARPAVQSGLDESLFIQRGDIIDIGPALRAKDLPVDWSSAPDTQLARPGLQVTQGYSYTVGDMIPWLRLDSYRGSYYRTNYTVMTITQHCEVWVQNDLEHYNLNGTPNLTHPDAKDSSYVTPDKIAYLVNAFNTIIYPTNTSFFGMPNSLDGSGGHWPYANLHGDGDKIIILVSNIRDDMYYDPLHTASFIIGFYSSTYEYYSNRNMITIDSRQWFKRVGDYVDPQYAYDYDNTLAHEFQHLLHDDYSPNEDSWVNEGMSGLAEFLNGYWFTNNLGGRTQWQTWPQNSIVMWGDQDNDVPEHGMVGAETLADYHLVNAFMLYTTGRIGGVYTDTAKLTRQAEDGVVGFNTWLSETATTNPAAAGLTFDSLFKDFRRDMLYGGDTNEAQPQANWNAGFIGDYQSPLKRSGGRSPQPASLGVLRDNLDREGYDWPGVPPYGTNYIEVCLNSAYSGTLKLPVQFDGDGSAPPTAWLPVAASDIYTPSGSVAGDVLFSGYPHGVDNFVIYGPLSVSTGDQLSFDHYYNFEALYDYGFVQVTTDTTGLSGWISLGVNGTITENTAADPIIANNMPGFNGFSNGWVTATHDLNAYAGQNILLAFRFSSDANTAGIGDFPSGWAIDNAQVGSTVLTDGAVGSGRSIQEVRNMVTSFTVEFLTWDGLNVDQVYTTTLDANQDGMLDLAGLSHFSQTGDRGVLLLSAKPPEPYDDLIAGGIAPAYAGYRLVGLPPSFCTSDVDAWSSTHAGQDKVYAGDVMTASVHLDNIGTSASITTLAPSMVYAGMPIPANTTFQSATNGAVYAANLQTVAASFPAVPGVYWDGTVTRTLDFDVALTVDAALAGPDYPKNWITTTVYLADMAGVTLNTHEIQDTVYVVPAIGLSALAPDIDPVFPGQVAQFTANVINMSPLNKQARLVATHPADTTFVGVTGATIVATSATQVTVTQVISPYATAGAGQITFQWRLGPSYGFGDRVTSQMTLEDTTTGETWALSASARVNARYRIYLPVVMKNF